MVPKMLEIYNNDFNEHLTLKDVTIYNVDVFFPRVKEELGILASEYFFDQHAKELFLNSDAIQGAKEGINILRKYGKIIVVTYQKNLENIEYTLKWLDNNGIIYDSICFTPDKSIIKADYIIDDNLDFFVNSNCTNGIVIDRAYNRDTTRSTYKVLTMRRFTSLYDFAKNFENEL